MLCCLVGRVWGTARWGPAPAPCPLCPPQPPWAAGQWLSLPTLYESGLCCVFPRILVQQSWFSDHQPVSLSHPGTTTSGTRGERVSLPGASLKSSLSSFGGLLSAVSLQVLSCSAGQERGFWEVTRPVWKERSCFLKSAATRRVTREVFLTLFFAVGVG